MSMDNQNRKGLRKITTNPDFSTTEYSLARRLEEHNNLCKREINSIDMSVTQQSTTEAEEMTY